MEKEGLGVEFLFEDLENWWIGGNKLWGLGVMGDEGLKVRGIGGYW